MPKKRNYLGRKEARQLEDWLLADRTVIESGVHSLSDLADSASRELGTTYTRGNVKGALTALNIKPDWKQGGFRNQVNRSDFRTLVIATLHIIQTLETLDTSLNFLSVPEAGRISDLVSSLERILTSMSSSSDDEDDDE